jgi:hypothetical protein
MSTDKRVEVIREGIMVRLDISRNVFRDAKVLCRASIRGRSRQPTSGSRNTPACGHSTLDNDLTRIRRAFHVVASTGRLPALMREAFVPRLGGDSDPAQRRFIGWIEEVDTGRELHFKSTDELLTFLAKCLEATRRPDRPSTGGRDEP